MLFLHAFLPTYSVDVSTGDWPLYVVLTPLELALSYPLVGWIVLLPSLMGLHALVLSAGRTPGDLATLVHWIAVICFFLVYALAVVFTGLMVILGATGDFHPPNWLATVGLLATALLITTIAGRALLRHNLYARAPTLVQILLCQALLMIMAAPALLSAFMRGPTMGGIILGVGATLLLVGSRKWVKGLLAPSPQPPGPV